MIKTIALIGIAVALTAPHAALAETPSGYGTEGPKGQRLDAQAQGTYARQWNQSHESQWRAESSAEWVRHHGKNSPLPY